VQRGHHACYYVGEFWRRRILHKQRNANRILQRIIFNFLGLNLVLIDYIFYLCILFILDKFDESILYSDRIYSRIA